LRQAAQVNPLDKFQLLFKQTLESLFIERMEMNEELFTEYMSNAEMQALVDKMLGAQVFSRLSQDHDEPRSQNLYALIVLPATA